MFWEVFAIVSFNNLVAGRRSVVVSAATVLEEGTKFLSVVTQVHVTTFRTRLKFCSASQCQDSEATRDFSCSLSVDLKVRRFGLEHNHPSQFFCAFWEHCGEQDDVCGSTFKIKSRGPARGAERSETACLNGFLEDVAAAWHRGQSCRAKLFFYSVNIWLIVLQLVCTGPTNNLL